MKNRLPESAMVLFLVLVEDADVAIGKTVFDKICQMEMEEILPNKNDKATALLVDTSLHIRGVPTKYYAKRDADNWKITYGDAGFSTRVEYRTKAPSLFGWDVEHCLGLERHDACIRPASVHLLMPHQRLSMIKGFRDILWRKDVRISRMTAAHVSFRSRRANSFATSLGLPLLKACRVKNVF